MMMRMPGRTRVAMCSSIADSAPKDEVMTMSDPKRVAAQETIFSGSDASKRPLSSSRSATSPAIFSSAMVIRLSGLPDSLDALDERIEEFAWNAPAIGGSELDVFFVLAVKIAAAGFQQAHSVGDLRIFFNVGRAMIAVNDLQASQAQVLEILDDAFQFAVVEGAKLNGVGENGKPAGFVNHLQSAARSEALLVEIRQSAGREKFVECLLDC